MITIFICICIEYDTPYAIILTIFGISVACDPYFVDTFSLSESISLWVSSFLLLFKAGYVVLPNLVARLREMPVIFPADMAISLNLIWNVPLSVNHDNYLS